MISNLIHIEPLSKSRMKSIHSLQQKKYRDKYQLYIVEGEKIVMEYLHAHSEGTCNIRYLCCKEGWLASNRNLLKDINIYSAALTAAVPYHSVNFKEASAIVVGTEATGLTPVWLEQSTKNIIIPMFGEIDSMNVSVSASIILFEAVRQRTF